MAVLADKEKVRANLTESDEHDTLGETLAARDEALKEITRSRDAVAFELEQSNRRLRETREQLIQHEKMVSLGQLVAGIAHEINNPLAFIVNNLFLVESGLDILTPEIQPHLSSSSLGRLGKIRNRLGEMKDGLNRVKELVLDLRTFSRLDQNERKVIDVPETIDAVLLLLNYKMNGRIHVEKRYGPQRKLYCYPGRLHQVLLNLTANAVEAISGEGRIVIETSQTAELFLISIRDNGPGIPEEIRDRIFDLFLTTKPAGQGTGLGLAISRGIVEDHGGSIEVKSQEGAGAEFIVKIPLNRASERAQ